MRLVVKLENRNGYKSHYRKINRLSFNASGHSVARGSRFFPLKVKRDSLALRIASLFDMISSKGVSSELFIEWPGRASVFAQSV